MELNRKELVGKLSEMSLFGGLSPDEIDEISRYLKEKVVNKKEVIFSEGDSSEYLYIVGEGRVKITKLSQEGRELIIEIIPPFQMFGGVAVIRGFPYPANAVAMEEGKVFMLKRRDLLHLLDSYPQLMYNLALEVGERVKGSHEMLKNIALEKVESRIASLLLKLAEKTGSDSERGRRIEMKLTKQDIAEMVGTTVETAIRTMSRLKKKGFVEEVSGRIVITDPAGLEDLSA